MRQLRDWLAHWHDEAWYIAAFMKWRAHIESFDSLAELIHDRASPLFFRCSDR